MWIILWHTGKIEWRETSSSFQRSSPRLKHGESGGPGRGFALEWYKSKCYLLQERSTRRASWPLFRTTSGRREIPRSESSPQPLSEQRQEEKSSVVEVRGWNDPVLSHPRKQHDMDRGRCHSCPMVVGPSSDEIQFRKPWLGTTTKTNPTFMVPIVGPRREPRNQRLECFSVHNTGEVFSVEIDQANQPTHAICVHAATPFLQVLLTTSRMISWLTWITDHENIETKPKNIVLFVSMTCAFVVHNRLNVRSDAISSLGDRSKKSTSSQNSEGN